jgi:thiol-disulfide isomerase/thioredoxin
MVTRKRSSFRLLALAAALMGLADGLHAQIACGDIFPPLSAAGLDGVPPQDTAGKVVIVDFWASWCAPCKASFPVYSRLQRQFAGQGLVIIGISVDESQTAFSAFVAKYSPSFITARDSQQKLVDKVQVPTMPTSYLIDRNGRVRFIHAGFHGSQTEHELLAEIGSLLDAKGLAP